MSTATGMLKACGAVLAALGVVWACGFDDALREYLNARFWQPFVRHPAAFERRNVRRISSAFAGMSPAKDSRPLDKLRAQYQRISTPQTVAFDPKELRVAVAAARAGQSLTGREREEVDLIDAKIDMRAGGAGAPELLETAQQKLRAFLKTARTPAFRSEARGWLAYTYYLLGDQTAAGKIYLDELNRNGSNLSRETMLNSLAMNYGYDGGPELLKNLDKYFDTPEHAAFAIQLATNPHWNRYLRGPEQEPRENPAKTYGRVKQLLEQHQSLLVSSSGANALALLAMRTALRMGDPAEAKKMAGAVPADAPIREEPDFNWMLASALFLSRDYAAAEQPLLALFQSGRASENQKAAAAYGLCGVYWKTENTIERLRFALWLHAQVRKKDMYLLAPSGISDLTVYWAVSGWDLNLLLDSEASIDALQSFIGKYPDAPEIRLVKYSLAVLLARENRYEEAANIYESINAGRRGSRMRQLAALYEEANRRDLTERQGLEAKYKLAEFIGSNSERVYFNDALWHGLQRYAMQASGDSRLTRAERQLLIDNERRLKDDQEERWRAYLILSDIVHDAGSSELGRKAARLAVQLLIHINERFGREKQIRSAVMELSKFAAAHS